MGKLSVLTVGTIRTDLITDHQTSNLRVRQRIISVVRTYNHSNEHGTTPGEITLKKEKKNQTKPHIRNKPFSQQHPEIKE